MTRRRWLWLLAVAVAIASLTSACNLLAGSGGGNPPAPYPIPTTATTPSADEKVTAWMQRDGPCLFLFPKGGTGPSILPIWTDGFSATSGSRSFLLYPVPLTEVGPIGISELMELHGQHIEEAPTDAVVQPECAKYPLFLVGTAVSLD